MKFRKDRRNYLLRLHQAARRYPVDILTYMITSNHVHLLFWAERAEDVSRTMHFLQGTVAGDYNRRKAREGAFWRGRHNPTLIQSGSHLSRCLFYIDLNMVRAKVCDHPMQWLGGAFGEILGDRQRYTIINRDRLKRCLGLSEYPDGHFLDWYEATVNMHLQRGYFVREAFWSEAVAVGNKEWVDSLLGNTRNARIECADSAEAVCEGEGSYAGYLPKREKQDFWHRRE